MPTRSAASASSPPSLPPPCPKSPPDYPDLYGKRRETAMVQMLEREIGYLQEELKSVEGLQPASRCCKEVADFVVANSDPLIPTYKKNRRRCRFWKWLCGFPCFNLSWICCCCCCDPGCSIQLEMPRCCDCKCNPCNCLSSCISCTVPKCKCVSCPRSNCCKNISCSKLWCIFSLPTCNSCSCCECKCKCHWPNCLQVNPCCCSCCRRRRHCCTRTSCCCNPCYLCL